MATTDTSMVKNIQIKGADEKYSGYDIYAIDSQHATEADHATSADNATIAESAKALNFTGVDENGNPISITNIGNNTQPVYLKDGVLTACTESLGVVKSVGDGLSITDEGELSNDIKIIGDGLSLNEETGELSSNIKTIGTGLNLDENGKLDSIISSLSNIYQNIESPYDGTKGASAYAVQQTYAAIPKLKVTTRELFDEAVATNDTSSIYFVPDAYTEAEASAENVIYDNTETGMASDTVQDAIDELKNELISAKAMISTLSNTALNIDDIYPIGSIYLSMTEANPSTIFGGEWQEYGDSDQYLRLGGTGTGGSNSVTLKIENLPSHNHNFTGTSVTSTVQSAHHSHSATINNNTTKHKHNYSLATSVKEHSHLYTLMANEWWANYGDLAIYDYGSSNWLFLNKNSTGTTSGNVNNGLSTSSSVMDVTHTERTASTSSTSPGVNTTSTTTGEETATHNHTITINNDTTDHTHNVTAAGTISNTGSGTAVTIEPKYVQVHAWQRIA